MRRRRRRKASPRSQGTAWAGRGAKSTLAGSQESQDTSQRGHACYRAGGKEWRQAALQLPCLHQACLGLRALKSQHPPAARELAALSKSLQDTTISVGYPRTYGTLLPQAMLSVLCLWGDLQLLPLYVSWGMETRPAYCSKELTARSWLLTAVGHQACQETRGVQSPLALQESLHLELNSLCVQLPYTFSQPPAFLMWKETEYGSLESLILFEFKILAVMWITAGTCYSTSMQIWMWQMKDVSQRPVAAILGQEIPTKDHCWRWVGKLPCSSSPRQWAKEAATAAVLPS